MEFGTIIRLIFVAYSAWWSFDSFRTAYRQTDINKGWASDAFWLGVVLAVWTVDGLATVIEAVT